MDVRGGERRIERDRSIERRTRVTPSMPRNEPRMETGFSDLVPDLGILGIASRGLFQYCEGPPDSGRDSTLPEESAATSKLSRGPNPGLNKTARAAYGAPFWSFHPRARFARRGASANVVWGAIARP